MSEFPLARRQVHLDFHTSSLIPDIAKAFNPELFARQVKESAITSITCFGRCHHGMLYYPSLIHSDAIHPELACDDLLGEQIKACHAQGIKAPV